MDVATIQHWNYNRNQQQQNFAVYDFDTPVTLKQGQGHPTWYELLDLKQGHNHAKFVKPCLNHVHKKATITVFVKQETRQLSEV